MLAMEKKERKPIVKPYLADREALSLARARAGWTLEQMESEAKVSYTTISRIASGDIVSPQWHTLEKLAESVGLNANNLVLWRDRDLEEQAKHNKEVIHHRFDNEPLVGDVPDTPGLTEENIEKLDRRKRELRKHDKINGETDSESEHSL